MENYLKNIENYMGAGFWESRPGLRLRDNLISREQPERFVFNNKQAVERARELTEFENEFLMILTDQNGKVIAEFIYITEMNMYQDCFINLWQLSMYNHVCMGKSPKNKPKSFYWNSYIVVSEGQCEHIDIAEFPTRKPIIIDSLVSKNQL